MKKIWHSYKLVIFLVFISLIIIPIIVLGIDAINTKDGGYQALHGATPTYIKDISVLGVYPTCVSNTSANDYFVPTKTRAEWDAFVANHPSGTTVAGCCGDEYCDTNGWSGPKEGYANTWPWGTCVACPTDCLANSCGDGVCNGSDTHDNCWGSRGHDCCATSAECGTNGCVGNGDCSGNIETATCYSYSCGANTCSYASSAAHTTCGGGKNSTCSYGDGVCTYKCSLYPGYGTADYPDGKLTDCGGCGSLCTGGAGSGCNPRTNCYTNGGSCGNGGTFLNGACLGQSAGTCYPGCSYGQSCYGGSCISNSGNYCPAGYYGTGMSCTACTDGYYSPAGTQFSGGVNGCQLCSVGYTCVKPGAKGVQILCPSGMTSSGYTSNCYNLPGYNGAYGAYGGGS